MTSTQQSLSPIRCTEIFSVIIYIEKHESDRFFRPRPRVACLTSVSFDQTPFEASLFSLRKERFINALQTAFDENVRGLDNEAWTICKQVWFQPSAKQLSQAVEREWTQWREKTCSIAESIYKREEFLLHSTGWEVWTARDWRAFKDTSRRPEVTDTGFCVSPHRDGRRGHVFHFFSSPNNPLATSPGRPGTLHCLPPLTNTLSSLSSSREAAISAGAVRSPVPMYTGTPVVSELSLSTQPRYSRYPECEVSPMSEDGGSMP